jgi:hypothetical protein
MMTLKRLMTFRAAITDQQNGGKYRLLKTNTPARFDYVVGQHSWKKYLFPPEKTLFEVHRKVRRFRGYEKKEESLPLAFIGVRPCELAAIAILDKIMLEGPYQDLFYKHKRKNLLIVAVNCTRPSGTCFCTSMKTGPRATMSGFDLVLTESWKAISIIIWWNPVQKRRGAFKGIAGSGGFPAQMDQARSFKSKLPVKWDARSIQTTLKIF